jgi:hypothetical protein
MYVLSYQKIILDSFQFQKAQLASSRFASFFGRPQRGLFIILPCVLDFFYRTRGLFLFNNRGIPIYVLFSLCHFKPNLAPGV